MSTAEVQPIIEADEWRTAQAQFDEAAGIIKLEPWLREVLREVQREFTCHFPVRMDSGHTRIFTRVSPGLSMKCVWSRSTMS